MTRERLYTYLSLAAAAGYGWVGHTLYKQNDEAQFSVCLFKNVTGLPCPSCGVTRSVVSILKLNWLEAILYNPLGYFMAFLMLVVPCWIIIDLIRYNSSFFRFYFWSEKIIRQPRFAIPLVILVLINWAWNIIKDI